MDWEQRQEVIIGNYGEDIVSSCLEKYGFIVYRTNTNKSHPIDMICIDDKDVEMYFEVKTKPRRFAHEDTGIDIHSWNRYINFLKLHDKTIYIYFVDEFEESIYYLNLNNIYKKKKFTINEEDNICYFNLNDMKLSKRLTLIEILKFKLLRLELNHPIKQYDKYKNLPRYFYN